MAGVRLEEWGKQSLGKKVTVWCATSLLFNDVDAVTCRGDAVTVEVTAVSRRFCRFVSSLSASPTLLTLSAGPSVSRNGKSFDVRFKADLEEGQLTSLTSQASIPDEAYTAPKTYLPMRLANLQTTYHDAPLGNKINSGSLPTDDTDAEAQAQNVKAGLLMETNPNFDRALSWAEKLWIQLKTLFGKVQKALWCIRKQARASQGSTFSKPLLTAALNLQKYPNHNNSDVFQLYLDCTAWLVVVAKLLSAQVLRPVSY